MKKYKRALIIWAVVLAVLLVVPFLIPMSSYIGQVEQIASEKLGVPVKIGFMRVAILPTPRLNIGEVVVGDQEDFSVEEVAVVPALSSLFSDVKTISSIKVDRPVIKESALDILSNLSSEDEEESTITLVIREISVSRAQLIWPNMDLPEFDVDITLRADNKPESARFETTDGKLKLNLVPEGDSQMLTLKADRWTVPVGMPLLIDKLNGQMMLTDDKLDIQQLDAELYEGKVNVSAVLDWQAGWKMDGKLDVSGLELSKPVAMASPNTRLSGKLSGNGNFKAAAKSPAELVDRLQAQFPFKVENGVLTGVDLMKAASLLLTSGETGGETKFDTLSGVLNVSGKQYHLRNLQVASGALNASGDVKVKPNKALDGEVKVAVKKGATLVEVPLNISGTVDKPMAFPTKAALAGAAAGAAIAGPAGATVGIQAAEKLKNLFGGSKKD